MKNRLPTENDGSANTRLSTTQSPPGVTQPPRQEDSDVVTKRDLDKVVSVVLEQMDLIRQDVQHQLFVSQHGPSDWSEGSHAEQRPIVDSISSPSATGFPSFVTGPLGPHAFRYVTPPEDGLGGLRLSRSHAPSPSEFHSAPTLGYHAHYVDALHHQDPLFSHYDGKTGEGISHRDTDHSHFVTVKGNYILHKQDDTDNYWKRINNDDNTTLTANGMIVHNDGHRRQLVDRAVTGDLPSLEQENNINSRFTRLSEYAENTLNEHDELLVKKFPEQNKEIWTYVGGHWKFHKLDLRSLLSGHRSRRTPPQSSVSPSDMANRGNRYSMRFPMTRNFVPSTAAQSTSSQGYSTGYPYPTLVRLPPPSSPSAIRPLDPLASLRRSSPGADNTRDNSGRSAHARDGSTLDSGLGHPHEVSPSGVSLFDEAPRPSREGHSPSPEMPKEGGRGGLNRSIPSRLSDRPVTAFTYFSVPPGGEDAEDEGGWYSK